MTNAHTPTEFFLNLSFFVLLVYILFLVADIAVRTKNLTLTLVLRTFEKNT